MKLAIADPPYLGRANRWYGTGRGHRGGRGRADQHLDAARWDQVDAHLELLRTLEAEYDGWAYAAAPNYEDQLRPALPPTVRRMIWHRGNAFSSGARLRSTYEIVLIQIPESRRAHGTGLAVDDVLHAGIQAQRGFAGAKPRPGLDGCSPASDTIPAQTPSSTSSTEAARSLTPPTGSSRSASSPKCWTSQIPSPHPLDCNGAPHESSRRTPDPQVTDRSHTPTRLPLGHRLHRILSDRADRGDCSPQPDTRRRHIGRACPPDRHRSQWPSENRARVDEPERLRAHPIPRSVTLFPDWGSHSNSCHK